MHFKNNKLESKTTRPSTDRKQFLPWKSLQVLTQISISAFLQKGKEITKEQKKK
jgi:hypothetical protein